MIMSVQEVTAIAAHPGGGSASILAVALRPNKRSVRLHVHSISSRVAAAKQACLAQMELAQPISIKVAFVGHVPQKLVLLNYHQLE